MKSIREMSIGELAAFVATHLRHRGIEVVLTGGSCVSIYSHNRYMSFDLDFIGAVGVHKAKIKGALAELGFAEKDRYFVHPETEYFVEFPSGPLAVGGEPIKGTVELEFRTGVLRMLSATDSVKDRLAGYYHWRDLQCLEQAILVAAGNDIDLQEVERWSVQEGMGEEFRKIRGRLAKQG